MEGESNDPDRDESPYGSNMDEDEESLNSVDHLAFHNNEKSKRMNDGGSNDSTNDIDMEEHRCERGQEAVNNCSISPSTADDTAPFTFHKSNCQARNNRGENFIHINLGHQDFILQDKLI